MDRVTNVTNDGRLYYYGTIRVCSFARVYNAEYMKKYRQEHRDEWNQKQRERYAKKRLEST